MFNVGFLLIITASSALSEKSVCVGRNCYYLIDKTLTWEGASQYCNNTYLNGSLVNILSDQQHELISKLLENNSVVDSWIGLYGETNDWRWTGEIFQNSWTGWFTNEPDENNKCAYMSPYIHSFNDVQNNKNGYGKFKTAVCATNFQFLCQFTYDEDQCNKIEGLFFHDKCYYLYKSIEDAKNWHDANAYCQRDVGGRLAAVNSYNSMQNVIVYIRRAKIEYSNGIWIGLSKQIWFWSNQGEQNKPERFRWEDSSPDNSGNYVIMKKFDNGYLWKNVKDTETHKFVCQAQPEPSSYKEDDIWYWFKIGCIIFGSILIVVLIGISIFCLRKKIIGERFKSDSRNENQEGRMKKSFPHRNTDENSDQNFPRSQTPPRQSHTADVETVSGRLVPQRQPRKPALTSRSTDKEKLRKEQKQREIQNEKMTKLFSIQEKLRLETSPKREQYGSVVSRFPPSVSRSNKDSKYNKEKERSVVSSRTFISSNRSANPKIDVPKYGERIVTYNTENRGGGAWQWDMKSKPTVSKPAGKYSISASQSTSGYNSR